jgi:outer membrane protein assembly factor BamA
MANVAIGSVRYSQRTRAKERSSLRHDADVAFTLRAGTRSLQSDLVYDRYDLTGGYSFRQNNHHLMVSGMLGKITGNAPLFERFAIGDSKTLRGWNKFDIMPIGGNRVVYGSVEYRYCGVGMFVDAGSVWDQGTVRRNRVSTGVTYSPGPFFVTVGFPVNTNEFRAVFTMGYRGSNWVPWLSKF